MSVLSKLFTPSGTKFYVLFEKATANLIEMSKLFEQVAEEKDADIRKEKIAVMGKLENSNDKLAHKILIELGGNYITPFDREDIHYLASSLDEIAHDLWGITRLYHKRGIIEEGLTSSKVGADFVAFFKLLEVAVKGLRHQSSLNMLTNTCNQMRALNNKSDSIIENTIATLVNNGAAQPKALIQKMDYYELLQTTVGNCRKVVNVIDGIIIKYG